jgi:hypothetical protein
MVGGYKLCGGFFLFIKKGSGYTAIQQAGSRGPSRWKRRYRPECWRVSVERGEKGEKEGQT